MSRKTKSKGTLTGALSGEPQKKKTSTPNPKPSTAIIATKESKKRKRNSVGSSVSVNESISVSVSTTPTSVDFSVDPSPITISEVDTILQSYADVSKSTGTSTTDTSTATATVKGVASKQRRETSTSTTSDESVHKKKKQRLSSKATDQKKKESSIVIPEPEPELTEYPILHDKTQIKATELTKTHKDPTKLQSIDQTTNSVLEKIVPNLIKISPPINTDNPNPKPSSLFIKKNQSQNLQRNMLDSDAGITALLSSSGNYDGKNYLAAPTNANRRDADKPRTTIIFDDSDAEREQDTHIRVFDNISPPQRQTLTAKIQASVADKLPFANITSTDMKKQTPYHMDSMIGKWQEITEKLFNKKPQNIKQSSSTTNASLSSSSRTGGSSNPAASASSSNHDTYRPDIPLISREYIKSFLREPLAQLGERACMLGNNCISMDLCSMRSKEPFQLREFLLPAELSLIADKARNDPTKDILEIVKLVIEEQKPCILCSRYFIHRCASSNGSLGGGPITLIQNHGNRFNSDGEYSEDAMLVCGQTFSGIVVPIVRFDMTDYVPLQYDVFYRKALDTPGVISKLTIAKNSSRNGSKYQTGAASETNTTTNSGLSVNKTYDAHATQKDQDSKHMEINTYNKLSLDLDRSNESIQAKLRHSQPQIQQKEKDDVDIYTIDARGWGESSKIIYDAKSRDLNMETTTLLTERLSK
jgi:hypothetical protein